MCSLLEYSATVTSMVTQEIMRPIHLGRQHIGKLSFIAMDTLIKETEKLLRHVQYGKYEITTLPQMDITWDFVHTR